MQKKEKSYKSQENKTPNANIKNFEDDGPITKYDL